MLLPLPPQQTSAGTKRAAPELSVAEREAAAQLPLQAFDLALAHYAKANSAAQQRQLLAFLPSAVGGMGAGGWTRQAFEGTTMVM